MDSYFVFISHVQINNIYIYSNTKAKINCYLYLEI
jgi:hypothetical protein